MKKDIGHLLPASNIKTAGAAWLEDVHLQVLLLLVIAGLTLFPNLGAPEPSLMEARNFISAREMVESGHWLVPTLNGAVRLAKPPLPTWITAWSGLAAGDMQNVAALRLPAAGMAMLLAYFLFCLGRELTGDKLIPFLAAIILTGSVAVVNAGRQGTWDIYCHSFMLGAIWFLVKAWRKEQPAYGIFALCGLLLGCSFLSKGPVAFYTLLLPFLVSYRLGFGPCSRKNKAKGLLLACFLAVLISVSWPLYIYLIEPEALAQNAEQETHAWFNRHKQPFWYYWGFVAQTGAWTLFAGAALAAPYARRRIGFWGNYRFLFLWVSLSVVLLSVIPEKKERYLLPALVPLALLTAYYLRYLISYTTGEQIGCILRQRRDKWTSRIIGMSITLFLLGCCVIPVWTYATAYKAGLVSAFFQAVITVGCLFWAWLMLRFAIRRQAGLLVLSVGLLNAWVLSTGIPLYQQVRHPYRDNGYQDLAEVSKKSELRGLRFYAVSGMSPQQIWQVGKRVDTLRMVKQRVQQPATLPAAVFSQVRLVPENLPDHPACQIKALGIYRCSSKNPDERYYVYVLSAVASGL